MAVSVDLAKSLDKAYEGKALRRFWMRRLQPWWR
jgi:hypothetical protein